jgi:L-fucono-1,5-lactonase
MKVGSRALPAPKPTYAATRDVLVGDETPFVIDAHVHLWDADAVGGSLGSAGSVDRVLAMFDENEVAAGVAIQPSVYASDHTYLLEAIDRAPDRFAAVVLMTSPSSSAIAALPVGPRVSGVRLPLIHTEWASIASACQGLWRKAREARWVVNAFARADQLAELEPLLDEYPDVAMAIDHVARLDLARGSRDEALEQVLTLARHSNVHVKLSALAVLSSDTFPYRDVHQLVRRVVSAFGPARSIWGSDYPNILASAHYARSLDAAREALSDLTSSERARVFGRNACDLYFCGERPGAP